MARYRLTESNLRDMIRECIEDALYEGKVKDTFNKAVKYGKKQLNKFNQSIKDLTDEYDEDGNPIVDNPMYKGKKSKNESRLRGMIREAVKSALNEINEGKVVNNKPFFDEFYSGGEPQGLKVKPGSKIFNGLNDKGEFSWGDWDIRGMAKNLGIEKYSPEWFELRSKMQKHNERVKNYKLNGNRYGEHHPNYATLWGSKEANAEIEKDNREHLRNRADRLRLKKYGYDNSDEYGIPYADMLRMGYDFDHSTM